MNTPPPIPKKTIPLRVYTYEWKIQCDEKKAEAFCRAIRNIADRMKSAYEFFGNCEVVRESVNGGPWVVTITTPPIPQEHPLCHALYGVLISAYEDKVVYSMTHNCNKFSFSKGLQHEPTLST